MASRSRQSNDGHDHDGEGDGWDAASDDAVNAVHGVIRGFMLERPDTTRDELTGLIHRIDASLRIEYDLGC